MIACLAAASWSPLGQSRPGAGVGCSNTQAVLVDRPSCVLTPRGLVKIPNTSAAALTSRPSNLNVSSCRTANYLAPWKASRMHGRVIDFGRLNARKCRCREHEMNRKRPQLDTAQSQSMPGRAGQGRAGSCLCVETLSRKSSETRRDSHHSTPPVRARETRELPSWQAFHRCAHGMKKKRRGPPLLRRRARRTLLLATPAFSVTYGRTLDSHARRLKVFC